MKSLFKRKNNRFIVERLIASIEALSQKSSVLVLVPGTTGYNWMGVNRATFALFPDFTLELPHYYSQLHLSKEEEEQVLKAILNGRFKHILLSGFPPYFSNWIKRFKQSAIRITVLYHGFYSEFGGNPELAKQFSHLVDLAKTGFIDEVAFNKEGMAESIARLCGIKTSKFLLKTPLLEAMPKYEDGYTHIGVLGNDSFRKNIYNQVAAALMVENSVVHVTTDASFPFLDEKRIIREGSGHSHGKFLQILGRMHVNLHLSYSESWGQVTTESLAMNVPCLIANHSGVLKYDAGLETLLVVEDFDNVFGISEKLKQVLATKFEENQLSNYIQQLNDLSTQSISNLLKY